MDKWNIVVWCDNQVSTLETPEEWKLENSEAMVKAILDFLIFKAGDAILDDAFAKAVED